MSRVYLSNIHAGWPFARQEAKLDEAVPGWRDGAVYRDTIKSRSARENRVAGALVQRADLTRATRRRGGTTVHVAALPPLGFAVGDFLEVVAALSRRGDTLVSLDCGTTVAPDATPSQVHAAAEAFERAWRRKGDAGKSGGQVSGERRQEAAQAACKLIEERWKLPSDRYPTKALLAEAGVSRPTAIFYLRPRREVQWEYEKGQKTAERNRSRKERGDGDD